MTIPALNTQPSVTFTVETGIGYVLPFDVLRSADNMQAWYRDEEGNPQDLIFGTDIIANFDSGYGTVFLVKDLALGSKFTIDRVIKNSQTETFRSTQLFSTRIEDALDKLTIQSQDNDFKDICIRTATDENLTDSEKLELPTNEGRIFSALMMNDEGKLSITPLRNLNVKIPASRVDLGMVIAGDNLSIEDSGLLDVPTANGTTSGVVEIGDGIDLDDGMISCDTATVISNAEEAISNSNSAMPLIAEVPTLIADVQTVATTAQTKVQEKVITARTVRVGDVWSTPSNWPGSGTKVSALAVGGGRAICCGSSECWYTDDGGDHWTRATTNPAGSIYGLCKFGTRVIAVGHTNRAAFSDDDGENWTQATTQPVGNLFSVTPIGSRVVCIGASSNASYSDDGGVNWVTATTPPSGRFDTVTTIGARLIAAGMWGTCAYSDDRGDHWSSLPNIPGNSARGSITVGSRVIIVGNHNCVYSDDGGGHWTRSAILPDMHCTCVTKIKNSLFAAGVDGWVCRSDDLGVTWKTLGQAPYITTYYGIAQAGDNAVIVGDFAWAYYSAPANGLITVPEAINRVLEQKGV